MRRDSCASRLAPLAGMAFLVIGPSAAAVATPYGLDDESHVSIGCFGGCLCPSFPGGSLTGEFELTAVGVSGPFELYDVTNVALRATVGDLEFSFVGEGSYQIGGALGLEQRLVLDLRLNGGPPQRYDSGIVAGGWDFPAIDVGIPMHEFACWDSVLVLSAIPGAVDIPVDLRDEPSLRVAPNPFPQHVEIQYALRRAGIVSLRVHDVAGRIVRTLVSRQQSEGPHAIVWDGRADDGETVAAGVYFARLDSQDVRATVRIVHAP